MDPISAVGLIPLVTNLIVLCHDLHDILDRNDAICRSLDTLRDVLDQVDKGNGSSLVTKSYFRSSTRDGCSNTDPLEKCLSDCRTMVKEIEKLFTTVKESHFRHGRAWLEHNGIQEALTRLEGNKSTLQWAILVYVFSVL